MKNLDDHMILQKWFVTNLALITYLSIDNIEDFY